MPSYRSPRASASGNCPRPNIGKILWCAAQLKWYASLVRVAPGQWFQVPAVDGPSQTDLATTAGPEHSFAGVITTDTLQIASSPPTRPEESRECHAIQAGCGLRRAPGSMGVGEARLQRTIAHAMRATARLRGPPQEAPFSIPTLTRQGWKQRSTPERTVAIVRSPSLAFNPSKDVAKRRSRKD